MNRNIVKIDEEKCNGCGVCVSSCAEGAIQIIDGKAKLVSDTYCDGLGACLGECPMDAITIEQREAAEFDETAAHAHVQRMKQANNKEEKLACGCPSAQVRSVNRTATTPCGGSTEAMPSALTNWPVQLKLVPPTAPYLLEADLLLVADCVPFALANFHRDYLPGKPVLIGCPKLDDSGYYIDKLADIIATAGIKSITIMEMEVPCCKGLSKIAEAALAQSGAHIPVNEVIVGISGDVLTESKLGCGCH